VIQFHARTLELLLDPRAQPSTRRWALHCPAPGWFRPTVAEMTWCPPKTTIGTLDVVGRRHFLITPVGVAGFAGNPPGATPSLAPHAVAFGDPIVVIEADPRLVFAGLRADAARAVGPEPVGVDGLVFRAPTSGRFYGRSAPDKPPFVVEGTQLVQGATVCLLEVMKTFNRVSYGGADLPEVARVRRVLVAEGADVNAGDPLLALE